MTNVEYIYADREIVQDYTIIIVIVSLCFTITKKLSVERFMTLTLTFRTGEGHTIFFANR